MDFQSTAFWNYLSTKLWARVERRNQEMSLTKEQIKISRSEQPMVPTKLVKYLKPESWLEGAGHVWRKEVWRKEIKFRNEFQNEIVLKIIILTLVVSWTKRTALHGPETSMTFQARLFFFLSTELGTQIWSGKRQKSMVGEREKVGERANERETAWI